MGKQEFKAGDRIEFTEDYSKSARTGSKGVVKDVSLVGRAGYGYDLGATQIVYFVLDSGATGSAFNIRMKLVEDEFKAGDRVVSSTYPEWGVLIVEEKLGEASIYAGEYRCRSEDSLGIFEAAELRYAPEAEEQEPEAQPVTYRICVGSNIGTTEYPSLEAAKEAALVHGNDKEEFSIFEVVKIADYRVKVSKELEKA